MDVNSVSAVIAIFITIGGYFFYIRDIFSGKTKPHAYSWLIWTSLTGIAFFGQISDSAGPGAWVTASSCIISFVVFLLALDRGEKDITLSDKVFLGACVVAVIPWVLTSSAFTSMIIITVIDFLGFLPTIRKSLKNPFEETLIHYVFAGFKFLLAIFALENYSVITWLYPSSLVLANLLFVVLLVFKRSRTNNADSQMLI